MTQHEPQEEYSGPTTVSTDEVRLALDADLRGRFDPIDGHFHWYGRFAASPDLTAIGTGSTVTVTTEHGSAEGRLSDVDPWGRLRITGTGRPPF